MTTNPDEVPGAGRKRADLITGLQSLAAWLTINPDTPLPVVSANWRVPAGPRGERLAYLDQIADLLGTEVTEDAIGTLFAERWFDDIRAEAHVCHPDRTVSGLKARVSRAAGNGAAA